jgi:hypothetical protein
MKNIHIFSTSKPSRLHYFTANKAGYYLYPNNGLVIPINPNCINQHIYITNDEEIKEGDWYVANDLNIVMQYLQVPPVKNDKKIILTTDQDLIKDGVQSIDDEFLEWFVKNPSCEFVEVTTFFSGIDYPYEIIIPKEEPKQSVEEYTQQGLEKYAYELEPKQETTLEEAAESWLKSKNLLKSSQAPGLLIGFIEGAKQQAEQMYSEEEVRNIIFKFSSDFDTKRNIEITLEEQKQWFEQFKKK